MATSKIPCDSW